VSRLLFAGRFGGDLERIRLHLLAHNADDVEARLAEIVDALQLLTRHPLIGRKVGHGKRELVIGHGSRGYVALYAFDRVDDLVVITALRAQREAGFAD
jgi:plasmid stabilization system protein ParE